MRYTNDGMSLPTFYTWYVHTQLLYSNPTPAVIRRYVLTPMNLRTLQCCHCVILLNIGTISTCTMYMLMIGKKIIWQFFHAVLLNSP